MQTAEASRRLAVLISTFVLAACGAAANAQVAAGQDAVLGVWVPAAAPERLLTTAGAPPPLNPEAARVHAARLERLAAGDTSFDQATWCASPGMPRVMTMPYPFEIRRDGDFLAFMHGWYRWFRVVNLSDVDVDPPLPSGRTTRAGAGSAPAAICSASSRPALTCAITPSEVLPPSGT